MATYPIDEMPFMEQEALPSLNPTYYASTYEAEALAKGLFLDERDFDDYYPTSFTTPSSDLSATINPCLLTSPATSLHSQEDNTGFLSFDAEQALLGMEGSQSLFLALEDQQWTPPPPPQQEAPASHQGGGASLHQYGISSSSGTWRCAHPGCTSRTIFTRGCDLRKHYRRHSKHLFCRREGCPQATEGGFSSKKDRARHEAKHNPVIMCEWEGCRRVFSRGDNMRDHVKRIHLGKKGG